MNITCRLARVDERDTLEALQRRASLKDEFYREQLLSLPGALELPSGFIEQGLVIVAEDSDRPLGFAVVLFPSAGRSELEGLFVDPPYWRQGVGTLLIGATLAHAKAAGARHIDVVASPTAREFYECCGFYITGEARTTFGPALAMTRSVNTTED